MAPRTRPPDGIDLNLLVPRRSKIQAFLLDLHKVGSTELDARDLAVFQLLLGAGFALWRAVFYTRPLRRPGTVQSSAQDFLLTLVTDNAISYYQEARAHAWTSGFY